MYHTLLRLVTVKTRYKFFRTGFKADSEDIAWKIGKWEKIDCALWMDVDGFHCSKKPYDAFSCVPGEILAVVAVRGKHLSGYYQECWEEMRIVKAYKWQKNDSVLFAIFAARQVIQIYEKKHPDKKSPRQGIEAAEAYQKCPCAEHQEAAAKAVREMEAAVSWASRLAAWAVAWVTAKETKAAASAVTAAWAATEVAATADPVKAAREAAWAARMAAMALPAVEAKCNRWMKNHMKNLEVLA